MEKVKINSEKCKGCLLCAAFCPEKCIKSSGKLNKSGYENVVFIDNEDNEKCKSCGFCFLMCPDAVIEVFK